MNKVNKVKHLQSGKVNFSKYFIKHINFSAQALDVCENSWSKLIIEHFCEDGDFSYVHKNAFASNDAICVWFNAMVLLWFCFKIGIGTVIALGNSNINDMICGSM